MKALLHQRVKQKVQRGLMEGRRENLGLRRWDMKCGDAKAVEATMEGVCEGTGTTERRNGTGVGEARGNGDPCGFRFMETLH